MNVLMKNTALALMTALPLSALAQEQSIKLIDRSEQATLKIVVSSIYDFEKELSLKFKTDPRMDASDVLIKMVQKFAMTDTKGVQIKSGFDIDMKNNLVVAFSGGTSEIIKTAQTPDGFQIIGSFKDSGGNFISPPPGSLAVYNLRGEKLCFDYHKVSKTEPAMSFALLLDRSGSMSGHIEDVKKTANEFLNILPASAMCAVASFNGSWEYGHENYQPCSGGGFGFEGIEASGGTDIYAPLKAAYKTLSGPSFNGQQKAVIIISDGYTIANPQAKSELIGLKKDVLTFVYFIGGNKKDELKGLTDHFIARGDNVRASLSQYFTALGRAYNTQKVLSVRSCKA